mgnify:CR=1 FL=1
MRNELGSVRVMDISAEKAGRAVDDFFWEVPVVTCLGQRRLEDGSHQLIALGLGEVKRRKTVLNLFQDGNFEGIGRVMFPKERGSYLIRPLLDLI